MSDLQRIESALAFVPADDRDTWLHMGMAVKSELGEDGFSTWDSWSQGADSYKASVARNTWESIDSDGGVTIGTLYREAKANGWQGNGAYQRPTAEELAKRKQESLERQAREQEAIQKDREQAAAWAKAIWEKATEARPDHPYLDRKRVSPTETLREIDASEAVCILDYHPQSSDEALTGRLLVVPVKQGGSLSTLELIDEEGRKAALKGRGTKTGGYWATERLPDGDGAGLTLLIGEGAATVMSASEATGLPAIAALSSGNLVAVAKAMRERLTQAELVILADLVKADGATDQNAIKAALAVKGRLAIPDFGPDRDPGMTDFNDMAVSIGKEAVQAAIEGAGFPAMDEHHPGHDVAPEAWLAPQPLTASYAPEDYPLEALPEKVRAAVEAVRSFVQAPVALVASSAVAALSLAIQAHVDIRRASKLEGPVALFLLIIALSSERKSTCDGFFSKAIRDFESEQRKKAEPELKRHAAAMAAWEAKYSGTKDKIKQLAKDGKPTANLEEALHGLEQDKPEPPRVPRLMYADATPEALAYGLAKQWPSGGVVSAEAGTVFGSHGMGKDSVMRSFSLMNQLWDGGRVTIDRRTSESFDVDGARLTMALQVQKATLDEFFKKSGELARGSGFLARFLVAWPTSTQGFRPFTEQADMSAMDAFDQRLTELLNMPVPINEDGTLTPHMLTLSPEAKRAWVEYHNAIERELRSGGELQDVRDVAGKSADNAARLAALFQVFEHGISPVSLESFESASRITAWHLTESLRFFGEIALPAELADAAKVDRWLIQYCQQERLEIVSRRHLQQYGPVRDKMRLEIAVKELEELDRLRVQKDGKSIALVINPALIGSSPTLEKAA